MPQNANSPFKWLIPLLYTYCTYMSRSLFRNKTCAVKCLFQQGCMVYSQSSLCGERAGVRQMLQQRLIRFRLERERGRGGRHLCRIIKSHCGSDCALHYLSAYASVWHCMGDDPFQCKSGARGIPPTHTLIIRATRLAGGRAQAKNLLTHALCRPVLPAFVRNGAYSPSIMASWVPQTLTGLKLSVGLLGYLKMNHLKIMYKKELLSYKK